MKDKPGISDDLLDCEFLLEPRTVAEVAEEFGKSKTSISAALSTLYTHDKLTRYIDSDTGVYLYKRPVRHWIWSTPLTPNPPKCFGERCWK